MNSKRAAYLLALLVIMAVIIVPAVVNSRRPVAAPAAGAVAPSARTGSMQVTTDGGNAANVATQAAVSLTDGVKSQEAPSTASPAKNQPERQGCQVGIAVVGIGQKVLYPPASVIVNPNNKWGITALGALDATGLPYAMKPAWPDFVDSISGQACKGVSGWMYMVNGEIPMHMSDKNPIKDGDKVIWWYSESMDQEPPVWDKLVASQH